jgi:hypothetical protein
LPLYNPDIFLNYSSSGVATAPTDYCGGDKDRNGGLNSHFDWNFEKVYLVICPKASESSGILRQSGYIPFNPHNLGNKCTDLPLFLFAARDISP